jgi:hypothetical protein
VRGVAKHSYDWLRGVVRALSALSRPPSEKNAKNPSSQDIFKTKFEEVPIRSSSSSSACSCLPEDTRASKLLIRRAQGKRGALHMRALLMATSLPCASPSQPQHKGGAQRRRLGAKRYIERLPDGHVWAGGVDGPPGPVTASREGGPGGDDPYFGAGYNDERYEGEAFASGGVKDWSRMLLEDEEESAERWCKRGRRSRLTARRQAGCRRGRRGQRTQGGAGGRQGRDGQSRGGGRGGKPGSHTTTGCWD